MKNAQDPGSAAEAVLEDLNRTFVSVHTAKEDAFWNAKMGLNTAPQQAQSAFAEREIQYQEFLQAPGRLASARAALAKVPVGSQFQASRTALEGWVRTLNAHTIESQAARDLAAEIVADEARLEHARGEMKLGYRDAAGTFVPCSSVKLSTLMRTHADENVRRSAFESLTTIEPYVIEHGFADLLRKRNRLGRMQGAEDYYDWKVRRVEGLTKAEIFAWLVDLEQRTRESARQAIEHLRAKHGADRITPWNLGFLTSGDITREQDPYFPFQTALAQWGRSFANLGIDYCGAELVLDLVDRPGKYDNGFMHGPVVAWRDRGRLVPARIQFTANALPGVVGAGQRALATLFHEGGHAAHFANIDMPAPCFGQEYAPTSTGFSETQSMFLDSLVGDADWRTRYARNLAGESMPFELIERGIRANQPLAAWGARSMLAVCFGERALYELPDADLHRDGILGALRKVERELLFLDQGGPLPILAVPHLLSGESSAYYHGYVLAELAVHQTRRHFRERDGHVTDNPRVGPQLRDCYWKPGNSRSFDQFVIDMTGRPLSAQDFAQRVSRSVDQAIADARASVERMASVPMPDGPIQLGGTIRIVHGRETIAESGQEASFDELAKTFSNWIGRLSSAAK